MKPNNGLLKMEIEKNLVEVEHGNIQKFKIIIKNRLFVENYFPINNNLNIKLGPSLLSIQLKDNIR